CPLPGPLRERFACRALLSVPLAGQATHGRLLVLGQCSFTADELALLEILAPLASSRLDDLAAARAARVHAALSERMRLARDLHDGLLQSLTAAALRGGGAATILQRDPAEADSRLLAARETIGASQRDLRGFISEAGGESSDLQSALHLLAARAEREWGVYANCAADP